MINKIAEQMATPEKIKELNKPAFAALQAEEDKRKKQGEYIFRFYNDRLEDVPPHPGIIGLLIIFILAVGVFTGIFYLFL